MLFKNKKSDFFTVILSVLMLFSGCSNKSASSSGAISETASASLKQPSPSSSGAASQRSQNDWFYYVNDKDGGTLYRSHADGKDNMKVSDAKINFNYAVADDWVYYQDFNNGGIYKIKGDGTGKSKISDCNGFPVRVHGGELYLQYSEGDAPSGGSGFIYKIALDGTGLKRVCEDAEMDFTVYKGYIFYNCCNDGFKLYRIRTDGTEKKKLSDDTGIYSFTVGDDTVYYIKKAKESDTEGKIRKMNLDGNENTAVGTDDTHAFAVSDGIIYYSVANYDVYRINPDGSGKTKVPASSWEVIQAFGAK